MGWQRLDLQAATRAKRTRMDNLNQSTVTLTQRMEANIMAASALEVKIIESSFLLVHSSGRLSSPKI